MRLKIPENIKECFGLKCSVWSDYKNRRRKLNVFEHWNVR